MTRSTRNAVVYYFGFPHYRREILQALEEFEDVAVSLVSGSRNRANIAILSTDELPRLNVLKTWKIGPFSWDRGVVRYLYTEDAVVVGPATTSVSTWCVLFIRRVLGHKTYLWGQCGRVGDRSLKRRLQEAMNRLATGCLVYGRAEAAAAGELGLSKERINIVNNATTSNARFTSPEYSGQAFARMQNAAAAATDGRIRLAFVGRLNRDKRIDVLLQAARLLRGKYPGIEVEIVGRGDAEDSLKREFDDEWIRYHGWIYDRERLQGLLEQATLVVSPYHMGLLAVDALRFGVPALVPDNPMNGSEVEALTPGVNSIVFRRGDPIAIASAIEQWLKTAPEVSQEEYTSLRNAALMKWEPAVVARNILRAISVTPAGQP